MFPTMAAMIVIVTWMNVIGCFSSPTTTKSDRIR